MKFPYLALLCMFLWVLHANGQESRNIDRQLYESLREAHDKGADLYNKGEPNDCYRMFQGALITARGLLGHHPELQKLITDGMTTADREESITRRAFLHHELIEKVRGELRGGKKSDVLTIPPREVKPEVKAKPIEPKPEPKPMAKVNEVQSGVVGRVHWQGQPLANVEVTFVSLGVANPVVHETLSGAQGVYALPMLKPGKYVIILTPGPNCAVKKLPERYVTTTTSPLLFDVKGNGEKLDFMLQ